VLFCTNNQLTVLPDTLPAGLQTLHCAYNQLLFLSESLPSGLLYLYCFHNSLTRLPETLPADLDTFDCYENQLTSLPETLPSGLRTFHCYSNNLPDMKDNESDDDESIPEYVARVKAIFEAASKERIVQRCALIFEELAKTVWHPSRVERRMLAGVDMEDM
jgi:hypothetical protein